jgi:hypothetical protein
MTSINVNFCKEGFNPSYNMAESLTLMDVMINLDVDPASGAERFAWRVLSVWDPYIARNRQVRQMWYLTALNSSKTKFSLYTDPKQTGPARRISLAHLSISCRSINLAMESNLDSEA